MLSNNVDFLSFLELFLDDLSCLATRGSHVMVHSYRIDIFLDILRMKDFTETIPLSTQ